MRHVLMYGPYARECDAQRNGIVAECAGHEAKTPPRINTPARECRCACMDSGVTEREDAWRNLPRMKQNDVQRTHAPMWLFSPCSSNVAASSVRCPAIKTFSFWIQPGIPNCNEKTSLIAPASGQHSQRVQSLANCSDKHNSAIRHANGIFHQLRCS